MSGADDHEQAAALADLAGAQWGPIGHPLEAAAALQRLLDARPVPDPGKTSHRRWAAARRRSPFQQAQVP